MARRLQLLLVAVSALLPSAAIRATAATLPASSWVAEVVDAEGEYPDAAVGPNGPAIAYTKSSPTSFDSIWYAYRTNGWHIEEVPSLEVFPQSGQPQLAFDANGDAWILYEDELPTGSNGSRLMHRTGPGSWEEVATISGGSPEALELAPDGSIAMTLYRGLFDIFAWWDGSTLHTSRIARGRGGALAFERDRAPAVAYVGYRTGLSFAVRRHGTWRITVVDATREVVSPSLGFAPGHVAFIAYTERGPGSPLDSNLRLANRGPMGNWRTRPVDTGRSAGVGPSLAVGPGGEIYIASIRRYFDDPELRLATHTSAGNESQTLFPALRGFGGPSLVIGRDGGPHIAFVGSRGLSWASPAS
jgi:hypothetical protein